MTLQVLIVEDDLPSLELLSEVLQSLKVNITGVSDSMQAARLIDSARFDGVFLDLQMPGLNGFELAARVRKSPLNRRAPVVIITGSEEQSAMADAFKAGATFFLKKPIDRQRLLRLFRTVSGSMEEARRKHQRVRLRLDVLCHVERQSIRATTLDISLGGLLLACDRPMVPGAKVDLEFNLPGRRQPIRCSGMVRNANDKGQAGVEFVTLAAADRGRLAAFIAEMNEAQPEV